ncbi:MAG TPA: endonuclease/exonuclease/phosphatase family protein [Streptosporangiaceae bacterium]|nr:endonuclease/exonuclease/phosphatase family protein [Streptosporangiaceae bacterium]
MDTGSGVLPLRVLTLNAQKGRADPAAVVREIERHRVDVLMVQDLTPGMMQRLADASVDTLPPFCHLDLRPGPDRTGLWARWPLTPLPPVPGLVAAAPRARMEPVDGCPVTLTGVHLRAPMRHRVRRWQRELAARRSALAGTGGHQVVAGDFNATRDHRPFRDLLDAGFLDCADAARRRPGRDSPGQSAAGFPGHAPRPRARLPERGHGLRSRIIRVPGTDHRGVLAVIELAPTGSGQQAIKARRPQ